MSVARSSQMTAVDTLRWGGRQQFTFRPLASDNFVGQSKQLVNARWRWPISWKLLFIVVYTPGASETGTFDVDFQVTVGVGDNATTFSLGTLTAQNGGTALNSVQFFDIPAQEVNITANVTIHNGATTTQDNFTISAFIAPWTEPHAPTMLADHFTAGEQERVDQWMREGFTPEELGYHR